MIVGLKTNYKRIKALADTPVVGGVFLFVLIFIPAVLTSFVLQAMVPALHNDIGFTKVIVCALSGWNLLLWFFRLKLYLFYIPAWLLLGIIGLFKAYSIFSSKLFCSIKILMGLAH